MLPSRYVVVDTETTGSSASFDKIIEIGALVIENGKVVQEYETFLNPGGPISPFITALTGIHDKDLEDAPTFYELADEIHALFRDAVMVAHNARFDYGFLKHEFRRINKSFSPKQLCTVRLSRALLPDLPRHNLDTLIEHFQIQVDARHRAMGDARAVFEFLQKAETIFSPFALESAVKQVLKKPTLPQGLTQKDIDSLPDTSGVYIFYDKDGTCLYIGKSITIRERVLSHFAQDVYSATEMQIAQNVASIETIETAGELGALLKEASLVKSMAPLYNQLLRAKRRVLVAKRSEMKGFPSIEITELQKISPDEFGDILCVFKSHKQAETILRHVARQFSLCPKLLGLEKGKGPCFSYHLGQCKGACCGKETSLSYLMRFSQAFTEYQIKDWPFEGPIMVTEKNYDKEEGFVIDKWCLLGSITSVHDDVSFQEYEFDYDIYKILVSYLKNPSHEFRVHALSEKTLFDKVRSID